jgi:tRNA modification GTPase
VRISGESTERILQEITPSTRLEDHKQTLAVVRDPSGKTIDQVMVVFHPGPHSYTGEDLAEISCHGNPVIVDMIMDRIRQTGLARLAEKGEFSRRAFLNGKLDLIQAEAVGVLVNTRTMKGLETALNMIQGKLSAQFSGLVDDTASLLADLEASFMTEEADLAPEDISGRLRVLAKDMAELLAGARSASILQRGVNTTIAGLPNVGKSSLFNAILGYPRAIVHHEEGTTRDVLMERVTIGGIDFLFHDTAGIRDTTSGPEMIGVEKTIEHLKESDLVLYVVDARTGMSTEESKWLGLCGKTIMVQNKVDLLGGNSQEIPGFRTVPLSAKTGAGMDLLFKAMAEGFPQNEKALILDRHAYLLGQAVTCLEQCIEAVSSGYTPDVLAMDIDRALGYLRQLTGRAADEDVLDRIFAGFCIGK